MFKFYTTFPTANLQKHFPWLPNKENNNKESLFRFILELSVKICFCNQKDNVQQNKYQT